jgi:alkylation response protein AidB-like acyl-CoA dehydrogenase
VVRVGGDGVSSYQAPQREIRFVFDSLGAFEQLRRLPGGSEFGPELVDAILEETARWSEGVLAPLYELADAAGTPLVGGQVRVPEPVKAAYVQFVGGGWAGLTAPAEFGGQGVPQLVGTAVSEIWKSANLAFSLCPMLSQAAIEALVAHASPQLQQQLLPGLVSGRWTGTMNLTEPQAGSDLAAVQACAEPDGAQFRLRGRKIFITWGDHDMSENIVHLVLARTPDAPPGVKGLSLFAVPKYLPDADGQPGERNDVTTVSVEHKLGIRGSPTCALSYGDRGGAVAYLVGERQRGLEYMFTMMNRARLAVGVEGLAVAERAYQGALAFARERVQGRPPGAQADARIFEHPDVRRMLMGLKSGTEAMRGVAYACALQLDLSRSEDAKVAARARARAALLTPIVKGWCTEFAQELVSSAVQIHGGMGYIEDVGAAQWLRDVRITTIYEGTTGIQANDLVWRKLLGDDGAAVRALLDDLEAESEMARRMPELPSVIASSLDAGLRCARSAVEFVHEAHTTDVRVPGAAGVNLLLLLGTVLGAAALVAAARHALQSPPRVPGEAAFVQAKVGSARYFVEHVLPRSQALASSVLAGADSIMGLSDRHFDAR